MGHSWNRGKGDVRVSTLRKYELSLSLLSHSKPPTFELRSLIQYL